jgi:hypothetical protein
MGLDTTHDCWHGAYSAFHRWRAKICEVAGYGKLGDYEGFRDDVSGDHGSKPWPKGDPLVVLLSHSDCDGEIGTKDCAPLADALEQLLPALDRAEGGGGHVDRGGYAGWTRQFIKGLRRAAAAGEDVEFH